MNFPDSFIYFNSTGILFNIYIQMNWDTITWLIISFVNSMSIHVIFYITISCNVRIKLLLLALFYYYTIKSPEPTNQYNTSEYLSIGYLLFKQQFHISSINTLNCLLFFLYIFKKMWSTIAENHIYSNLPFYAIIF